jgi:hypothetical protein
MVHEPHGWICARIGYKMIAMEGFDQPLIWWWKTLWKYKFPTKSKILMCLLLNNRALTLDLLKKMKILGPWKIFLM